MSMYEAKTFKLGAIFRHASGDDYALLAWDNGLARSHRLSRKATLATSDDLIAAPDEIPVDLAPWSVRCHPDFSLKTPGLPQGATIWSELPEAHREEAERLYQALKSENLQGVLSLRRGLTRPTDLFQAMDIQAAQEAHAQLLSAQLKAARPKGIKALFEQCQTLLEQCSVAMLGWIEGIEIFDLKSAGAGASKIDGVKRQSQKFTRTFDGKEYEIEIGLREEDNEIEILHQVHSKEKILGQQRIIPTPCRFLMYHPDQDKPVVDQTITLELDLADSKDHAYVQEDLLNALEEHKFGLDELEIRIILAPFTGIQ
ncbi:hypothetical protein KKB55_07535 [Myxococcota bacterium]|nr:hypothetical protein [Myxococcota bacterium]MBU1897608.1 hypothetical protein [Myxococcota bacterium]